MPEYFSICLHNLQCTSVLFFLSGSIFSHPCQEIQKIPTQCFLSLPISLTLQPLFLSNSHGNILCIARNPCIQSKRMCTNHVVTIDSRKLIIVIASILVLLRYIALSILSLSTIIYQYCVLIQFQYSYLFFFLFYMMSQIFHGLGWQGLCFDFILLTFSRIQTEVQDTRNFQTTLPMEDPLGQINRVQINHIFEVNG